MLRELLLEKMRQCLSFNFERFVGGVSLVDTLCWESLSTDQSLGPRKGHMSWMTEGLTTWCGARRARPAPAVVRYWVCLRPWWVAWALSWKLCDGLELLQGREEETLRGGWATDRRHCGARGAACVAGDACEAGVCTWQLYPTLRRQPVWGRWLRRVVRAVRGGEGVAVTDAASSQRTTGQLARNLSPGASLTSNPAAMGTPAAIQRVCAGRGYA